MNNDFSFYVPADIDMIKSDTGEEEHRIRGYASNTFKDRQDDSIVQEGLDISNFVNYGWLNYDHDNKVILGYPDKSKTKIDKNGFWVEGVLIKGIPLADKLWELACKLKKSNAPRKLGFSVEGKILERGEGGKIKRAKIYNVAVTPNPVNPTATWDAVCKSFSDEYQYDIEKSLETSYETKTENKTDGGALTRESLHTSLKTLASVLGDTEDAKKNKKVLREQVVEKSLDVNESILFLQLTKGLSQEDASNIVTTCLKNDNKE